MPVIYVSGNFVGSVILENKDYPYSEWIDTSLKNEREERNKPTLTLWLEIENKDDPISPFTIPVSNLDVYEGGLKVSQSELTFTVNFDGKAKPSVHKDTKAAIDAGGVALATGVAINGAQHLFQTPLPVSLKIQSKKL
jgi:hypothetical protein